MNAIVTSLRRARFTTRPPTHAISNANNAIDPHCPGETQTRSLNSSMATRPPFVGLKTCLPRKRMTNLLPMVMTAASIASRVSFVRSSRQSERPEISALFQLAGRPSSPSPTA